VSGATGTKPTAQIKIAPEAQLVSIDGFVDFLGVTKQSISIKAELLPQLNLHFSMMMDFIGTLQFQLMGAMLGKPSFTDISGLDFSLTATMQQEIITYLATQVNVQFALAKHAVDTGILDAKSKVATAQQAFNSALDRAQKNLDSAQAAWTSYSNSANTALTKTQADAAAQTAALRDKLTAANKSYADQVTAAQNNLASATAAAAAANKAAQDALTAAQAKSDAGIALAQSQVKSATGGSHSPVPLEVSWRQHSSPVLLEGGQPKARLLTHRSS
jgi:hypothetical protein